MKHFISLLLMLVFLFTYSTAFAEGNISPSAYIEEPTVEPNATRRIFISDSIVTVYTSLVRKNDVYVTFHSSESMTSVQVQLLTKNASGVWEDESGFLPLALGATESFNLSQPKIYQVRVSKGAYYYNDAYCTFYIEASP